MKIKELQQDLAAKMKQWQKIEDASLVSTSSIIEHTENPVVRLAMEIIQRDTLMHHAIQQWIADSLEDEAAILTYDDLKRVWEQIEYHIDLEKKMIESVKGALALVKDTKMVLQGYLLEYLLEDETKHANLLKRLEEVKMGLLP